MREKPKGFLTVVENVYHQLIDSQPHGGSRNFQVPLYTEEQSFERRILIDEQPKTLAQIGCWLTEVSYVVLYNEHGQRPLVNPSEADRLNVAQAVIEIGQIIVRPGRSCRFEPVDLGDLTIKCQHGKAMVIVTVYPR